jgi:ribosomal protein L29
MELHKIKMSDIQGMDLGKLSEVEESVRRAIATSRMDVYAAQGQYAAKKRGMRKGLARLLTMKNEQLRKASKKVK